MGGPVSRKVLLWLSNSFGQPVGRWPGWFSSAATSICHMNKLVPFLSFYTKYMETLDRPRPGTIVGRNLDPQGSRDGSNRQIVSCRQTFIHLINGEIFIDNGG